MKHGGAQHRIITAPPQEGSRKKLRWTKPAEGPKPNRMTLAHWSTQHERGEFPVEQAALAGFGLTVAYVAGEWQWLIRRGGCDVAEGAARAARAARQQAEAVALRFGSIGEMNDSDRRAA
jgi:hypothetical protein